MKRFIMRQKIRYDMGGWLTDIASWAGIVFLSLDRVFVLMREFNVVIPSRYALTLAVPMALVLRWLAGYLMDRWNLMHAYQDEMNERNRVLKKLGGE